MKENEVNIVAEEMQRYGGSFVSKLGAALAHADIVNARKIKETWPEYWAQYSNMKVKE